MRFLTCVFVFRYLQAICRKTTGETVGHYKGIKTFLTFFWYYMLMYGHIKLRISQSSPVDVPLVVQDFKMVQFIQNQHFSLIYILFYFFAFIEKH